MTVDAALYPFALAAQRIVEAAATAPALAAFPAAQPARLDASTKRAFVDTLARRGKSRPFLFIRNPDPSATRQRGIVYCRFLQRPTVPQEAFDWHRFRFSVRGWRP